MDQVMQLQGLLQAVMASAPHTSSALQQATQVCTLL